MKSLHFVSLKILLLYASIIPCLALKVHVSESTGEALLALGGFQLEKRGEVYLKASTLMLALLFISFSFQLQFLSLAQR